MISTHDDNLGDISNCVGCHPTGDKPEDDDWWELAKTSASSARARFSHTSHFDDHPNHKQAQIGPIFKVTGVTVPTGKGINRDRATERRRHKAPPIW